MEIASDPWLHCWWPVLAAIAALMALAILLHGYLTPSRFSAKLGVILSPESDINEGFFHPIHAQRGSGSGFYRDARIYIRSDFRLSAATKGQIARLRAEGNRVYIMPAPCENIMRQNLDGDWEMLPNNEETPMSFSNVYKNATDSLFFQLRNG